MIGEITNHLWQTTIFAAAVSLLAFAFRKNRAEVRYWMWLSASLKFLVPFSLLAEAGARLWHSLAAGRNVTTITSTAISQVVAQITRPFSETFAAGRSGGSELSTNWILLAAFSVWLAGFLGCVAMRLRSWLHIRAVLRASQPLHIATGIPIRSSRGFLEPGVVGFVRPVVLLPDGIARSLTPAQLAAVLAHEQAHARRRDNLTAAIHMIVEAAFWFHPMVWWIGSKLVEERERACDEAVLSLGNEPTVYAEGILNVCKSYLESPLRCVSGVTGSDLKKRIRTILSGHVANDLSFGRKLVLVFATAAILAAPVLVGAIAVPAVGTNPLFVSIPQDANPAKFEKYVAEVVSIKRSNLTTTSDSWGMPPGSDTFSARNVSLMELVRVAFNIAHGNDGRILGVPSWFTSDRYDIDAKVDGTVAEALQKLTPDQRQQAIQHMLLRILTDRCKLTMHRETRELPVYALVVAKSGSKLKETSPEKLDPSARGVWMQGMGGPMEGRIASMTDLAQFVSYILGRTTVDKTGLTGSYDFTVKWNLDDAQGMSAAGAGAHSDVQPTSVAESGEDIFKEHFFAAIQEQLGLKLESSKGPVEVIVIDRVERPSEN